MKWWDESWNPVVGCSPVSPACDNCYAARTAHRMGRRGHKYAGLTERVEIEPRHKPPQWRARFNGRIHVVEDENVWTQPLRWKKPRTIFVCNMGDLFHENLPREPIIRVLETIQQAPQHLFLLCTKRPVLADVAGLLPDLYEHPLKNAWIGTTVEDDEHAEDRLRVLAELRRYFGGAFVSYEPALGPVDWRSHLCPDGTSFGSDWLDWIVAGGESGPHARPSHPEWFRSTRDFCKATEVPFTFKQWGEWAPADPQPEDKTEWDTGEVPLCADGTDCRGYESLVDETTVTMRRVGKGRAGRTLDGEVHEWLPRPGGG